MPRNGNGNGPLTRPDKGRDVLSLRERGYERLETTGCRLEVQKKKRPLTCPRLGEDILPLKGEG